MRKKFFRQYVKMCIFNEHLAYDLLFCLCELMNLRIRDMLTVSVFAASICLFACSFRGALHMHGYLVGKR